MEKILLNGGKFHKQKFKTILKRKKLKMMTINYDFVIKLSLPIFIILSVIFIYLKRQLPIKKKRSNQILKIINNNNNNNTSYFACFCAMAREENKYAIELISYYSKLGIEKFIFGDNNLNGTEKLSDVLQVYIDKGIVDIFELFGSSMGQAEFNQFIYEKYKTKCNWFLFFDFDEYLEVHFENNVPLVLQDFLTNKTFDKCETILFNWLMYTDNDLIYYDNRPMIERFTSANYEDFGNTYVKSIVRGGLNKTIFYPKKSSHVPDKNIVICNSIGTILTQYNPFNIRPPIYKYGCLKHFATKSAEEHVQKTKRGTNRNIPYNIEDRIKLYFRINKFSKEKLKYFEKAFNRSLYRITDGLREEGD